MDISINEASSIAVYKQIVNQVITGLLNGQITSKTSLPSIRQLAADLSLTTATIAKAYQIMESARIITTAGRRGTFIHDSGIDNVRKYLKDELHSQIEDFISLQLKNGVSFPVLQAAFKTILQTYKEKGTQ